MPWSVDARVSVRLGEAASLRKGDALLLEGDLPAHSDAFERFEVLAGQTAGCACCLPRSGAATALDRLFQRRARGEIPFFRRVLAITATPEAEMAISAALRSDPLVAARFRLETPSP